MTDGKDAGARTQAIHDAATHDKLCVSSRPFTAHPITIAYRGHVREISPGQRYEFRLRAGKERDRLAKQRARADLQRQKNTTSSESVTRKELTA
jgi:hypothetical protein